jgi:hypothetical protein
MGPHVSRSIYFGANVPDGVESLCQWSFRGVNLGVVLKSTTGGCYGCLYHPKGQN